MLKKANNCLQAFLRLSITVAFTLDNMHQGQCHPFPLYPNSKLTNHQSIIYKKNKKRENLLLGVSANLERKIFIIDAVVYLMYYKIM